MKERQSSQPKEKEKTEEKQGRTSYGSILLDVDLRPCRIFLFGWRFPLDSDGRRDDGDDGCVLDA